MPPGTSFPRLRRPDRHTDPEELTAIRAAIEAWKLLQVALGPGAESKVYYRPQSSREAARLARKRMWNIARAEGYRLRTQIAQPTQDQQEWELVYQLIGPLEGDDGSHDRAEDGANGTQQQPVARKRAPRARR